MKELGKKALLYPQPVLIIASYDEENNPDAMTAAWGCVSDVSEVTLCLSKDHKTVSNILKKGYFTLSIGTKDLAVECDYFGLVSGHDVKDKISQAHLHQEKSPHVDAPLIKEFPLTLECKFKSFDEKSEFLKGEVISVLADEKILDQNGKVDSDKLEAISYDPESHSYVLVKGKVALAFRSGKSLY